MKDYNCRNNTASMHNLHLHSSCPNHVWHFIIIILIPVPFRIIPLLVGLTIRDPPNSSFWLGGCCLKVARTWFRAGAEVARSNKRKLSYHVWHATHRMPPGLWHKARPGPFGARWSCRSRFLISAASALSPSAFLCLDLLCMHTVSFLPWLWRKYIYFL